MIVRERYMRLIRDFMDKPVIKIITGMRRSGKSALLELTRQELLDRGVDRKNIIFINFESLRYEALRDYKALYAEIIKIAGQTEGRIYVLLDEIQEVNTWEQVINSLRVDLDCDIYVTGSNAKLLSGELATLLAGRYVEIQVYPLDFEEYLAFAAENEDEANLLKREQFANFLRFGGLPGIHQLKWDEDRVMQYLHDIYNSVLLKDVIARNRIRDTALLESIVLYLMDNIGNTFSAKTISDFLKSQGRKLSTETVYNYLKALESAFLIHKVVRFDIKGKAYLRTLGKYYIVDIGLRNYLLGFRNRDSGHAIENVVYFELLRRGYDVAIGKIGNAEVDFIATTADEKKYIQVTESMMSEDVRKRELAPLQSIRDNYEKIVLSLEPGLDASYDGIKSVNLIDWLLGE